MQTLKEKIKKEDLRKIAISKRDFMAKVGMIEKISKKISTNIINSSTYKNAKNIALYYPIKNEIDITSILSKEKNFYFPKCINNEMFFIKVNSLDELKKGAFNIPEPKGNIENPKNIDVFYIPTLLANKNCYRLGYGKGFYDRFFKSNSTNAKKIIVLSKVFVDDTFIQDEFDYKLDEIITED